MSDERSPAEYRALVRDLAAEMNGDTAPASASPEGIPRATAVTDEDVEQAVQVHDDALMAIDEDTENKGVHHVSKILMRAVLEDFATRLASLGPDAALLNRLDETMDEWTPTARSELGRVGRLELGPPGENRWVRLAYDTLAYVQAQLRLRRMESAGRRAPDDAPEFDAGVDGGRADMTGEMQQAVRLNGARWADAPNNQCPQCNARLLTDGVIRYCSRVGCFYGLTPDSTHYETGTELVKCVPQDRSGE